MNYEEFKTAFIEWSINNVEPDKGDGWPVCPYARKARLNGEIQFMDGRNTDKTLSVLETFDDDTFNMAVCWMGSDCPVETITEIANKASELHPQYYYFVSTETSGNFVQMPIRFYRDTTDPADTYSADVGVYTLGYHLQKNMLGSRQITTK